MRSTPASREDGRGGGRARPRRGAGGSGSGPTWTRCRSSRKAACRWASRQRPAACTPAGTTAIPRCCWARRATSPRPAASPAQPFLIFQPAEEGGGGGRPHGRGGAVRPLPGRAGLRPAQLAPGCRSAASRCARGRRGRGRLTSRVTVDGPRAATPPMPQQGRDPVVATSKREQRGDPDHRPRAGSTRWTTRWSRSRS